MNHFTESYEFETGILRRDPAGSIDDSQILTNPSADRENGAYIYD